MNSIFWEQKAVDHPEVDRISDLTKIKLRSVLFKMMREAGLITKDNYINTVMLSPLVQNMILMNNPNEMRWFTTIDNKGDSMIPDLENKPLPVRFEHLVKTMSGKRFLAMEGWETKYRFLSVPSTRRNRGNVSGNRQSYDSTEAPWGSGCSHQYL